MDGKRRHASHLGLVCYPSVVFHRLNGEYPASTDSLPSIVTTEGETRNIIDLNGTPSTGVSNIQRVRWSVERIIQSNTQLRTSVTSGCGLLRLKGEARLTVICNCYLEISQASSFNLISSSYLTPDFIWILSAPKESLEKIQMKSGVRYELDMRLKELA